MLIYFDIFKCTYTRFFSNKKNEKKIKCYESVYFNKYLEIKIEELKQFDDKVIK